MDDWLAYLTAQGGRQSNEHDWVFPNNDHGSASAGTHLVPLTHLSVLECDGPDAARFLQGQTSANVDHADGDFAPLTAFCTPKGRMIANAEVLKVSAERYWLLLHTSLAASLATHLGKYAPFYKVKLSHRQDLALIGMIGYPESEKSVAGLPDLPRLDWHMTQQDGIVALRQPAGRSRAMLILPAAEAAAPWESLSRSASAANTILWRRADIDAGVAWLTADHSDAFLPQMINWEALGGISFRKGCYTGQEVVARAHFRGQVKRRLRIASLEGSSLPAIGEEIRNGEAKRVGEIFQAVNDDDSDSCAVLAVLNTSQDEESPLFVGERHLVLRELPYPLERLDPESVVDGTATA
ncbi:folate-binding protein YgfZ [Salinicola sp. CR57]|uniref:CAF17-like 4Fe-4S cluster assembly/insertion protein YgfZ n=1 Tax=Salinicola sp. CR57 TaxID=1949086 RepID=UPI000DA25678|nr:folate-binding protein YgfZ [Salinicola sp. CR57]